ncbi:copper resistance CopC/CopD family protein [Stackebrandtia nassauensis]|uniref:Copper resistance protein CopC n=1 Tax=Stackebrandtia nassauensis (strain DSM 44728 / CIP 108903 / NRRL B-16338 / NBRC 102104 / LLR-40K-21) TaxID=446470 RepID=D3PYY3_STANL|nr:copper resistance protein CopC [Stackebrandtia nassauensis]ADD45412.1 copper resistance protein CopC [Stackebrandtia nassauensis DSM 44728]
MRSPVASLSRRATAALLGLITVAAVLVLSAVPASAHATLVSSTPQANKTVPEAPDEVVIKFSEPVSVVASGTGVTAPDGSKAHAATPKSEGEQVRYQLRGGLPDGTYVVSYRVISADGHPVPGGFTFSIGKESKVPEAADPGNTADPLVTWLVYGNRFLGYVGLLLVLGPSLLLLAGNAGSRRGAVRFTVVGLSLVAATAVVGLYLQAPYTAGTSLFGVTGADIGSVLGSRFGGASMARLLLVLIALPLLRHAMTSRRRPVAASSTRTVAAESSGQSDLVHADVRRAEAEADGDSTDSAEPSDSPVTTKASASEAESGEPGDDPVAAASASEAENIEPDGSRADGGETDASDAASEAPADGGAMAEPRTAPALTVVDGRPRAVAPALSSGTRWLLLAVATALAATWPVSGHATTSAAPALTVLSDTVHIGAATVWLGGLLTLAFFLVKRSRTVEAEAFLPTWSRWATWIVASLAIAGLAQALIHVGTVKGLVSTTYGWKASASEAESGEPGDDPVAAASASEAENIEPDGSRADGGETDASDAASEAPADGGAMAEPRTAPALTVVDGRPRAVAPALSSGTRWLLLAVATALAATWPVSGHATTSAAPALTVLSDTVHIGAATVWLGGLLTLAFFLVKRSRTVEAEAFLPTWSRWATWIVASLAIAGLAQALIHVGTVKGLVSTTYGWLVIAKIALFAVVLGTAALARKAVRHIGDKPAVPLVRRLILTELLIGALVLGLSSVLVQAVPAQSAVGGGAEQGPRTFSKTFKTDLYTLQFELEPVAVGKNEAHLYLFEPDGVTELEATEWEASFGRPKDGIELVPFDLALLSPNHTNGDVDIPQKGKWTFEFTIRISKLDRETVSTVVSVK